MLISSVAYHLTDDLRFMSLFDTVAENVEYIGSKTSCV